MAASVSDDENDREYRKEYEEAVIRRLVSPVNMTVSMVAEPMLVMAGMRICRWIMRDPRVLNGGRGAGESGGVSGLDAMRQALPMVRGILLMAI